MMRKLLLLFVGFILTGSTYGQSRNVNIYWDFDGLERSADLTSKSVDADTRRERLIAKINLQLEPDKLSYHHQWEDTGFANENSIQVSNVSYGTLTREEQARVNLQLVPNQLQYSIASTKGRDIIYTMVNISPVVRVNGQLRKVLSFTVNYTYKARSRNLKRFPITNSVLATGDWYQFKVEKTGVHRISKSFLNDLGMNTDGINPRNIKIYGHGGKPLPLPNEDNLTLDLPENAIQVVGEEDGSFDNNDFILFYGTATEGFDERSFFENRSFLNPYSDESYYYITVGPGPGRRVSNMVEPTSNGIIINQFDEVQFHELDEFSPAKVGRKFVGNRFDIENEQSFEFTFPNMVTGQPVTVEIRAAAASESSTSMSVSINSTSVSPMEFGSINDPTLLRTDFVREEFPASGETITVDLVYNNAGNPSSVGYLDYIRVDAVRSLQITDGQLPFRYYAAANLSGIGEYQLLNTSNITQIWDVTNPAFISAKQNETGGTMNFKANLGEVREYVAVHSNDYFAPVKGAITQIPNQDLKGSIFNNASGNFEDIDYLIVTAPFMLQPALRLANHHKNTTGLRVKVVTTDKIYHEFSSGKQDISAIRNFVRYIYENGSSEANRIKYLCLFGDTSVDMKNRFPNNNNIVPTYHTISSESTLRSYMTDDFFVFMDPEEGNLENPLEEKLDLAVGRILADNVSLANTLVDKIIGYDSRAAYGNWRNNFVLVSDDVDEEYEYLDLEVTLDSIGDRVTAEKPYINVKKIHSDAFQQETSAGGNRYPEVTEAMINSIEVGALILNYFGHGGEDGLAKEFIFTKSNGENLQNKNRYPCIVTVTCEFTKFDNPLRITGGELTYWNSEGGAISLITTTRSITVSVGVDLNEALALELFGFGRDIPNPPAKALMDTKNDLGNNDNKRVVFYVGDPAMRLAFPKQSVRITTLNDVPIAQSTDVLQALSRVKLGGEVLDPSGNVMSNYNGKVEVKVFDKDVQRQTLGNDGVRNADGQLLILDFKTLGEVLFNGQATVTNGTFDIEFVVPRDIQIPVGNGKVSLYSERDNQFEDQTGFNLDIQVGGLNEDAPEDNQGPLINLFMNDESFVSGGITNDSPILIAKLEDENGINTASGIGHDIVAILDGDEANPFLLNEYYQAEVDDFTRGKANYKLRDLEEGLHTLTLKAWDVYNNSSTAEIQFVVFGNDKLEVQRVLNYPNPFVNYTEFWFEHNRPMENLDVQVQIFTVTGKVVKTMNRTIMTDGGQSRDIVWDGRDDFGDKIGKGVYVYKLTVKSSLTNQQVEKFEKLVIL